MKKIISLTALTVMLAGSQVALADTTVTSTTPVTAAKVCVVQIAKILQGSPQIQQDVKDLKKKFDKDQKKIEADQSSLDDAVKNYKKNEMVMSAADKDKANKDLATQRDALLKEMNDFQTKLSAEQKAMMEVVFKKLNTIIQAQAQTASCNVVLDSQFVLWADSQFDITSAVQAAFDKEKVKK